MCGLQAGLIGGEVRKLSQALESVDVIAGVNLGKARILKNFRERYLKAVYL